VRNLSRLRLAGHPGYVIAVSIGDALKISLSGPPYDIALGSRLLCFAMGFFSTLSRPHPRDDKSWLEGSLQRIKAIHPQAPLVVVSVSCTVCALGLVFAYMRHIRRIPNTESVSANDIAEKRWITGIVTRYLVPARACTKARGT